MISIIICSINPADLKRVCQNISSTIGSEFELLVWDNRGINKGLCEVYNELAGQAKYEYVLFLHEDILFKTNYWGNKLIDLFNYYPEVNAIGVAGSKYKSNQFSGWYTGVTEFDCANIIHRYSNGDEIQKLKPSGASNFENVVCLDGVFISCRKQAWQNVKFDELNLKGFHFYDIDFTLRMAMISKIAVTYEIDIVHITKGGDFGEKWVKIAIYYHLLMKTKLPLTILGNLPDDVSLKINKSWLDVLKKYKITRKSKWQWISKQGLIGKPSLYYAVMKFILYRPLRLKHIHKRLTK